MCSAFTQGNSLKTERSIDDLGRQNIGFVSNHEELMSDEGLGLRNGMPSLCMEES